MDFANRPITDFYRHYLPTAYDSGFSWVCTLLARDADVERLYDNLRRCWGSFDSITDKHILFIFAGNYLNRARQYRKTTTLYLLSELLTPEYLCIKISFEGLGNESFETTDAFCDVLLYFTR